MRRILIASIATLGLAAAALSQSNIDPANKFAWGENMGWTNWQHDRPNPGDGVVVSPSYLAGFLWGENIGWINVGNAPPPDGIHYANDPSDSSTFGVNIDLGTGDLFGLAWGENLGWINFDTASLDEGRAQFDHCERSFFGFAWSENAGWINLNDATAFVGVGPCSFGDIDCDGNVARDDYTVFQSLFGGPDVAVDCPAFDRDEDDDIDLLDFAAFQVVFTE